MTKTKSIIFGLAFLSFVAAAFFGFFFWKNSENQNSPETKEAKPNLAWERLLPSGSIWSGRDSHVVVAFNDKLWLYGGIEGGIVENELPRYETMPYKNDIWVSDNGKDWELVKEHAEWGQRRSMTTFVFKDKIFLIGGWQKEPWGATLNDIWVSENGIDWKLVKSHAEFSPREGTAFEIFNDKVWVIGGVDYFTHQTMNDVWYSEDGITWVEATSSAPFSKRYDHVLTNFNDKLYLTGGIDFGNKVKKDLWVTSDGINWELVSDNLPWPSRHGHVAIEYNDIFWVMGGWSEDAVPGKENGKGLNDVWYSKDGSNWEKIKKNAPWPGREDVAGIVFNNKLLILGGMADEKNGWVWENDVWQATQI